MQIPTIVAVLFVSVLATSMAWPAGMAYYQQPSYYYQSRAAPQRMMYMRYVQQPELSQTKTYARLSNDDTVLLSENASVEQQVAEESVLENTGADSLAEAYPAASAEADNAQNDSDLDTDAADAVDVAEAADIPEVLEDEAAAVADELPSEELPVEAALEPAVVRAAEPKPAAVAPPKGALNDDEDDDEASPAPLSAGSYFPINFGGTGNGAIAIANSFSTGAGGKANSQAVAYGKPKSSKSNRHRRH